jgi:hypothetical protein
MEEVSCVNHTEHTHTVRESVNFTSCRTGFKIFKWHKVSPILTKGDFKTIYPKNAKLRLWGSLISVYQLKKLNVHGPI